MIPALALGGCKSALEIPVVETGWDIYTGGQYRYGPSIIVNKDGSVDAWFAAPGGYHDDGNLKFDADAVMKPVVLGKGMTAAQRFAETKPFYSVRVICPNQQAKNASLTFSLYRWDTDYKTTLRHRPVATQRYENYKDNQSLELVNKDKFPYGEYLWTLSDGNNDQCMVWQLDKNMEGGKRSPVASGHACRRTFRTEPYSGIRLPISIRPTEAKRGLRSRWCCFRPNLLPIIFRYATRP